MEFLAVFHDEDSFNRMFSYEEGHLNFMQQILHQFSFSPMHDEWSSLVNPSTFCPNPEANMGVAGVNESLFCSSNALDSNFHYQSQESSWSSNSSSSVFVPQLNYETDFLGDSNHIAVTNGITMSLDISTDIDGVNDKITDSFPPAFTNIAMGDAVNVIEDSSTDNANELLLKRKFDVLELHDEGYKINTESSQTTKKRARLPKDSNKNRKNNVNGNEESNIGGDGQSSSTSSSDDDNVSQALNLNGKRRTSRGSATDPQSLYARKRRERINERLRLLQSLVPNGTKVDTSTMLEDAIHYVKFLQLQIKLLNSDELWMYAPIAYNGVNIGLNKKIYTLL